MTIDEAIKHYLEAAEEQSKLYSLCPCPCDGTKDCMCLENGKDMGCTKCSAENRQLAEWLTEYKVLREENINLKNEIERLRDCVDSCVHNGELDFAELKEAKRLLKSAVSELNNGTCVKFCSACANVNTSECQDYKKKKYIWVHTDEALNVIGDEQHESTLPHVQET